MEKRIDWKIEKLKSGITAFNKKGEELGWLELRSIGRHKHWCWFQNEDILMSPGCLEEVREKQKELFNERKPTSESKKLS